MTGRARRSPEQVRFWQELRRSNAAQPHRNKARYVRREKHRALEERQQRPSGPHE